jgi:exodeoxyribonuclease VII large subunit
VLILARGGGAVEDLSCFNNERVVRAIAASSIPTIAGIGHQRDETLADLVADVKVHTPTAAAELVVPDYSQLITEHQQRIHLLVAVMKRRLAKESDYLAKLRERLKRIPTTSQCLLKATAQCELLKQKLITLNPQTVLQRGYAVVKLEDNTIVRSTAHLAPEQELLIQFERDFLRVKIIEIINDNR